MFDMERVEPGVLPEGLAEMPPGPELGLMLGMVDRERLTGFDRVILLRARSRQLAHIQAELYADMVSITKATADELGEDEPGEAMDSAASEIRAALSWTRRAAEAQLELAHALVERVPLVWLALNGGWIDLPKARVICDMTLPLDAAVAQEVAGSVIEAAGALTTGQLRARLARLVIAIDPESAKKRYEQGLEERRVTAEANLDGTANLCGWQLPAAASQAVMRRINRLARAARSKDDPRSIDQLRADVFLDLLNGGHTRHGHDRAVVDINVDLTTLVGLSETPGEIPGWGPVISDIARQVVSEQPDAEHRVIVTHPDTGAVLWNGTTRRRPNLSQKRHVQTKNPTCIFPGCRMPASDCDLDHTRAWSESGPTLTDNLAPACRHDHRLKDKGWAIERVRPGTYRWTSPLGHIYTTGTDPP